jgi:hypothetical protein
MGPKWLSDEDKRVKRNTYNRDLIRRMRNGESLTRFDCRSSWFPPRPTIEKDKEAIEKLYRLKEKSCQDKSSKVKKEKKKLEKGNEHRLTLIK